MKVHLLNQTTSHHSSTATRVAAAGTQPSLVSCLTTKTGAVALHYLRADYACNAAVCRRPVSRQIKTADGLHDVPSACTVERLLCLLQPQLSRCELQLLSDTAMTVGQHTSNSITNNTHIVAASQS